MKPLVVGGLIQGKSLIPERIIDLDDLFHLHPTSVIDLKTALPVLRIVGRVVDFKTQGFVSFCKESPDPVHFPPPVFLGEVELVFIGVFGDEFGQTDPEGFPLGDLPCGLVPGEVIDETAPSGLIRDRGDALRFSGPDGDL